MTLRERADFARRQPREYVHQVSHPAAPVEYHGTIYRVDGIGPKSVPPTYGRPVFDADDQASSARMLGSVLVLVAIVCVGLMIWALGYALDAPAHLVSR